MKGQAPTGIFLVGGSPPAGGEGAGRKPANQLPLAPPDYLPRASAVVWCNVVRLIAYYSPCYLWLVTSETPLHDAEFSERHSEMMRTLNHWSRAARPMVRPDWGGIRVFERHPNRIGNSLHSHLVLRGRMEFAVMKRAARRAGLGNIWRHPDACTLGTASYLCKYLRKEVKIKGVRTWATVGTFQGMRCRDLEYISERSTAIKQIAAINRANGDKPFVAYRKAIIKYEHHMEQRRLSGLW